MIRFSKQISDAPAAGERWGILTFEIRYLDVFEDPEEGDVVSTLLFSATASGIADRNAKAFMEDNHIGIGFSEKIGDDEGLRLGYVSCIENSSRSDFGVDIEVRAAGLLQVLRKMSSHPLGFIPDAKPFANLQVWFPIYARDGADMEHLLDNMLNEPGRSVLRVELSEIPKGAPA
jgi:hypothetical protein